MTAVLVLSKVEGVESLPRSADQRSVLYSHWPANGKGQVGSFLGLGLLGLVS